MQNEFEKFVRVNREAFDSEQPSEKVWKNLEKQFGNQDDKKPVIYKSLAVKMIAVAAAVLLVSISIWYLISNKNTTAVIAKIAPTKDSPVAKTAPPAQQSTKDSPATAVVPVTKDSSTENAQSDYKQEIYYYAKLSEIKFNQLKRMEKDEPLLYKNFAGEIKKLDSTYHNLQAMLSGNVDNEAVLGAMLTNLKMQTEILNKQLDIIHTIKQSKKSKYENNYPSI